MDGLCGYDTERQLQGGILDRRARTTSGFLLVAEETSWPGCAVLGALKRSVRADGETLLHMKHDS